MRLSDIIRRIERIFEKKRKNPIQIEDDSNLESKLKNLKVGDVNTPIQISTDSISVDGLTITSNKIESKTDLTLATDGNLVLDPASQKTIINATDTLYFDGGSHTYIAETESDILKIVTAGVELLVLDPKSGDSCRQVVVGGSVTFAQTTTAYDASDTNADFSVVQKTMVTFGSGNITDVNLKFPTNSGNFVLLLKQDGTGSRTVTNWKVFDGGGNAAAGSSTVKFAGGSNPTLTTDANHVDIISFYWDATNEIAYGVATLDFQF